MPDAIDNPREGIDLSTLVIDDSNFDQYFYDARKHKPRPGQVLAKFVARADLVDGRLKRDLIDLLHKDNKAEAAVRVMKVLGGAATGDSIRVVGEMARDLVSGMSVDEVAEKPYRFTVEHLFWAERGAVPVGDPHWETISVLSRFSDKDGNPVDWDAMEAESGLLESVDSV